MIILSIETSCDETAAAVTRGRKIISSYIYSQISIHRKWGGVVPHLAKRAHVEKIDDLIMQALRGAGVNYKSIDYIAVTFGPGLAPSLEVGLKKAIELARKYNKKIILVNHMEGHIYSCFAQDKNGFPSVEFKFPYIALLISGGHTELVKFIDHSKYEILGKTLDDAVGESLDKACRMLVGRVYPGGPIIEALSEKGNPAFHYFTRPMIRSKDFNFSYSGAKTALYYYLKDKNKIWINKYKSDIAASFQQAIFESVVYKLRAVMRATGIKRVCVGGGVIANKALRSKIRELVEGRKGGLLFPTQKSLYGDNAAMIGVAAYYKAKKGLFAENIDVIDRVPRASLSDVERILSS